MSFDCSRPMSSKSRDDERDDRKEKNERERWYRQNHFLSLCSFLEEKARRANLPNLKSGEKFGTKNGLLSTTNSPSTTATTTTATPKPEPLARDQRVKLRDNPKPSARLQREPTPRVLRRRDWRHRRLPNSIGLENRETSPKERESVRGLRIYGPIAGGELREELLGERV